MKVEDNKNIPTLNLPLITQDDFHNNELWWSIIILASQILSNKRERKEQDKYVLEIFDILNRIDNCFITINRAKGFISCRPCTKRLDKNNQMTIIDYYLYHYDIVIHKVSTIRDLSYKLINVVFNLNIEDEKCGWNSILKHKDTIAIPGIMNLQQLYFKMLEKVENERNKSTHSGIIELPFLKDIAILTSMSQMKRLNTIPYSDPMAKGSYNEYLLLKKKKELINLIKHLHDISLSFIHILVCCLGRPFHDNLSEDLKSEFKLELIRAEEFVDKYKNKNNKLTYIFDWLIHIDEISKKYSDLGIKIGKKSSFKYF